MDDNESDELFTFIPKHSRNLQTAADQKLYEYTQNYIILLLIKI